jgi:hypothetical protein
LAAAGSTLCNVAAIPDWDGGAYGGLSQPKGRSMKKLVLALTALGLLAGSAPSFAAAQCRDKNGKFIKCPAKPKTCRDSKGHYTKCK